MVKAGRRWTLSSTSSCRSWSRATSSSTAATPITKTRSAGRKRSRKRGSTSSGAGISGGEEGALKGPSIMPGGPREAWDQVAPILTAIAAKVDGEPCCAYLGGDGVGHFVKMVHNGIEYGDMQLISEAYFLMKHLAGISAAEMADIFARVERGRAPVVSHRNHGGYPAADRRRDRPAARRGHPGRGRAQGDGHVDVAGRAGAGVPAPTITEAVYARYISALKNERVAALEFLPDRPRQAPSTKRPLSKRSGRRCTPPRSARTPRVSPS